MEKGCIFEYFCKNAWAFPLHGVTLLEEANGGVARCGKCLSEETAQTFEVRISAADVEAVRNVMLAHPAVFLYQDVEFPMIFDGVINTFTFSPAPDRSVTLWADNIGAVKEPDVSWTDEHGTEISHPGRAVEVVTVFNEIAAILQKAGVEKDCLRLDCVPRPNSKALSRGDFCGILQGRILR